MFTADFFKEETRNGYTISSKMKQVWAVELELLNELDRVCRALGVKYFLDSGTLLGAVRDNHFIPWDDDIDVIMLREDYEVLKKRGVGLFNDSYHFQCAYTDVDYQRGHAQLRKKNTCAMIPYEAKHVKFDQGIFIDIFVLDGLTPNRNERNKQFKDKNKIYNRMSIIGIPASTKFFNTIVKRIVRFFFKIICPTIPVMFKKYEKICQRYSDSKYVDKIMFRENMSEIKVLKRDWYADTIDILFEGNKYPIPIGYDSILKVHYGNNYITPAKAPASHGSLILDDKRSYKDVLAEM